MYGKETKKDSSHYSEPKNHILEMYTVKNFMKQSIIPLLILQTPSSIHLCSIFTLTR